MTIRAPTLTSPRPSRPASRTARLEVMTIPTGQATVISPVRSGERPCPAWSWMTSTKKNEATAE
jgi:hypothetical protein